VVHRGLWRHDAVAVKQLKRERCHVEQAAADFLTELQLLATLRHRHLVEFYGAGDTDQGDLFIVTELMERGSLADCLRNHAEEFAWSKLGRKVMLDASKGMLFLHAFTPPLTHFDIKPLNILVSADNVGKLCDFGLTKPMRQTVTSPAGMTAMYAAPEVLSGRGGGEKSDVFSFGVSVLEVYRGRPPNRRSGFQVGAGWPVEELLRGDVDGHLGCLCERPQGRPTALQVVTALRKLQI